ncbi:electron transfer flavoprotein subunit alpha/FixB family protein [Urechidicola vernalis]|uniref:Electron transfer flavoprotein subunit alpha/FixB family protein n=1 Tax=Urechidicola vernalis TaxID=3075600 RepID=A0ABU2Y671_9FLAO|nr:electron transfer flavoprotein subunit alpha/FixB family protein [Urechidicola sp. P050]MDT0553124.1 electron transfer flavoprotein subunit alpha/FixB family protein [Urechidicola sp. P050]
MSVLVYAESSEGKYKKVAFEATSYGKQVADQLGVDLHVLTIGGENPSELGAYGASNIISVNNVTNNSDAKVVANVIKETANNKGATLIIIDSSANGLSIAPLVAVNLNAGLATNVVAVPSSTTPFVVKRKAFSNKAFNSTEISSDVKVIGLAKNSFGILENNVKASVESFDAPIISSGISSTSLDKSTGTVTIADADTVVSGGRGLKGPENWGMIEELATVLGAATACSKPVSDLGWRPHNEHVGQTGKPVSSNLYIAIGISGAIQHLAGINASKVKVVINTDPEAPFFKAADYGIVGDAFEVVPSLIEKLKAFKAQNA